MKKAVEGQAKQAQEQREKKPSNFCGTTFTDTKVCAPKSGPLSSAEKPENGTISCCDRSSRLTAQSAFPFRRPLRWNKSWNKENAVPASFPRWHMWHTCLVRVFGRKCPTHFFCFQLIYCGALACMGCRISTGQFCHLHFVILEWLASFWPHFFEPSAHPVAQFSIAWN